MGHAASQTPDLLVYRAKLTWPALAIGLFVMCIGACILSAVVIRVIAADNTAANLVVGGLFGLPLFVIGAGGILVGNKLTVDLAKRQFRGRNVWGGPLRLRTGGLADAHAVVIRIVTQPTADRDGCVYGQTHAICLETDKGDFIFWCTLDANEALSIAARVAGAVGVPVRDWPSGMGQSYEPDEALELAARPRPNLARQIGPLTRMGDDVREGIRYRSAWDWRARVFGLVLFGLPAAIYVGTLVEHGIGHAPVLLFVLPFLLPGAWLAFSHRRVTIDTTRRRMTRRTWCVLPMRRREASLDEFLSVHVGRRFVPGKAGGQTAEYDVRLVGAHETLDVYGGPDEQAAWAEGEFLAEQLRLPLVDLTGYEPSVREDTVASEPAPEPEPVLDVASLPPAPAGMASTMRVTGDRVVFEMPPPGPTGGHLGFVLLLVAALAAVAGFVAVDLLTGARPHVVVIVLGGLALYGAFRLAMIGIGLLTERTRVEVFPSCLLVARRSRVRDKADRLGAEDVTSLEVAPGDGPLFGLSYESAIIAENGDQSMAFGGHLARDELVYIRDVISHVLQWRPPDGEDE